MLTPNEIARLTQAARQGAMRAATGLRVTPAFGTNEQVLELIAAVREGGEVVENSLGRATDSFVVPGAAYVPDNPLTVGLWHLDNSAADASANGNTLTLHNTSYTAGRFGYGLSLNGTNAYAECTLVSAEPIHNRLYLAAWVNPTASGTILDWPGIAKLYIADGTLKADFRDESFAGPAVTLGTWQLCHAQFDYGVVWTGVGDLFTRNVATFSQLTSTNRHLYLGSTSTQGDFLSGTVDEVLIAADLLVREDMVVRPAHPHPADIGYWRFNEGAGHRANAVSLVDASAITMVNNGWATGYFGTAAEFDGTAYGAFTPTATTAARLGIELIVQFGASGACTLIDQQDGLNFAYTGTHFRAALSGVTNPNSDIAAFAPALDTWYTVTLNYDGTAKSVWINGQKIGEVAATGTVNIPANPVHIAETHSGGTRFTGLIDSLLITRRVARPYYRPRKRFISGLHGLGTEEDWVLL